MLKCLERAFVAAVTVVKSDLYGVGLSTTGRTCHPPLHVE